MIIHPLNESTTQSSDAHLVLEIFRKLAEFRIDYDETCLHELFATLRRHMPEHHADQVMSDALVMDNEIRFRLPGGLSLDEDEAGFPGPDAQALMRLIAHAGATDHSLAAQAAEELGIENHRILRKCASVLASSLAQGGIEIGWEAAAPVGMPVKTGGSSDIDFRL
ncbi:MAG: hypothetical protein JO094_00020 [Hyphomicrobiales bacterium]|nr:hypothetical protein [Hyphomicrobiales bacterium]MBV8767254.1 hypothetical protein [Hyphomicrobiales bacterium]MBV9589280.1 hypothetical protein [Hyphomicrobiales bacterium]MBV9977157.1 hypothetical protein [Hyphomicrobiales bacterium]